MVAPAVHGPWLPPVHLYRAGREAVSSLAYRNDARQGAGPRRLLIKRTLSGVGTLYVGRERRLVPPGHAFLIERPGPYRYCLEETAQPWRFEFLTIGLDVRGHLLPAAVRRDPVLCLEGLEELTGEFAALVDLRLAPGYADDLLSSARAYRLFLALVAAREGADLLGRADPVGRFRRLLEQRFAEDLTLAEAAREVGYTPEAMARLFRVRHGLPPQQYLLRLRVRRACQLIEAGELPLKQIATACGFRSASYFGRIFRRLVGVSPGAYQRNPDPLRPELLPAVGRRVAARERQRP